MFDAIEPCVFYSVVFLSTGYLNWIICVTSYQAQRNNEDVNAIEPLFSVNIDHRVSHLYTLRFEYSRHNSTDLVKLSKHQLNQL